MAEREARGNILITLSGTLGLQVHCIILHAAMLQCCRALQFLISANLC